MFITPATILVAAALVTRSVLPAERVVVYVSVVAGVAAAAVGVLAAFVVSVMLAAALPVRLGWPLPVHLRLLFRGGGPAGTGHYLAAGALLADAGRRVLAHSGLYGSEAVISAIVTHICGSPQASGRG